MLRNFRKAFQGNQTPTMILMMLTLAGMVAYLAPSGRAEAPDNVVARVYGREIVKRDLDLATINVLRNLGERGRSEEAMAYAQGAALRMLVSKALMETQAERHHVVVADDEVRDDLVASLKRYEVFKNADGSLRPLEEVDRILQANQTSLREWESQSRDRLVQAKLQAQIGAEMPVDGAWLELENRARNEKVAFDTVSLDADPSPVKDPGDAPLQAYLKENGPRFQQGPRRIIQFAAVDMASFGNSLNPDDATLKMTYESKKGEYSELKASHILFKAATEEEFAAAAAKARKLREELGRGADFNKKAEELSEDPSAKGNKGDLGWFKSKQMVKEFEDAANALKEGEISQPVRTNFGVHLIKLEGRRTKTFEDVKDSLRASLVQERFAAKAKENLEKLRTRTGGRGDLAAAARSLGIPVKTSKPFLNDNLARIEGIPNPGFLVNDVFRVKVGEISKVDNAGNQSVVFKVLSELPSDVPPLAEIRAKVLDSWKASEAKRLLFEKAAAQAKGGDLKSLGEVKPVAETTVQAYPLAAAPGIRQALLDTPAGQATVPCWGNDGKLWIARITSRTPAPPLTFALRRSLQEELRKQLVDKQLGQELSWLETEGKRRPGFSSLWGRLNGIWQNPKIGQLDTGE